MVRDKMDTPKPKAVRAAGAMGRCIRVSAGRILARWTTRTWTKGRRLAADAAPEHA